MDTNLISRTLNRKAEHDWTGSQFQLSRGRNTRMLPAVSSCTLVKYQMLKRQAEPEGLTQGTVIQATHAHLCTCTCTPVHTCVPARTRALPAHALTSGCQGGRVGEESCFPITKQSCTPPDPAPEEDCSVGLERLSSPTGGSQS